MSARALALAANVLLGCGLHVEALGDLPDASVDGVSIDSSVDDTSVSDGFPDDAPIGTGVGIAIGQYHSCALVNGALFCWGDNPDGALGTGDTTARTQPTRVRFAQAIAEVGAGDGFTCFRADGGEIYCFGTNGDTELGLGDTDRRLQPTLVTLPGKAKHLAVGFETSCAIVEDGSLYCWGSNGEGQLGQDEWPPASGARPLRVGKETDWTKISGGQGHMCGIRAPGSLWCWGRNSWGELGQGPGAGEQLRVPTRVGMANDWIAVDVGQDTSCGVRADGSLWCGGVNNFGQVGMPTSSPVTTPRRVGSDADWASVSVDTFTVCARKKDDSLFCMGRNVEGQLGVGDNADRSSPTRVMGAWLRVGTGRFHTCAQNSSGLVSCAGANDRGQLGVGDNNRRNVLTQTK
jgi:alpha-tubulin suppressor-like RCC1 family protein